MIALDASVLIAHFRPGDAHAARAFDILDTDDELVLHPMTLAEVLVRPTRDGEQDAFAERLRTLGIDRHEISEDEPLLLARLRAETGLRLPDCCVLAAALTADAGLATFDARLAAVARDRGVVVHD